MKTATSKSSAVAKPQDSAQPQELGEKIIPCDRCGGRGFVFHAQSAYASVRVECRSCGGTGERR
jgi:DnaJ-class molecular chaperone